MLTPLPRPEIMQQRSTSLSAPLTIIGDIMGKLVAPLHPTLPLESDNNNHRGTHLPLYMLSVVARGDSYYLKRLLSNGMDPNLKDYDFQSPLQIAAAKDLYFMAKLLLEGGASVFTKDRWGNTPLDEAQMCGNKNLIKLLEDATSAQWIALGD
ncbi:hypothetical protein JHK87_022710 [Glycine soja]|nr:hypothetical protein JHK87_022710 [Glycine soja]